MKLPPSFGWIVSLLVMSCPSYLFATDAYAQSTGEVAETNPELEQLREEAEQLRLELEISQRQRQIIEASSPILPSVTSASQALDGRINLAPGQTTIESLTLAYREMDIVAERICADLRTNFPDLRNVIVADSSLINTLPFYRVYRSRISLFEGSYKELLPDLPAPPPPPGFSTSSPLDLSFLSVPTTVLRSFIDLVALFRSDVSIRTFTFSPEENALISNLATNCQNPINVYHPDRYLLDTRNVSTSGLFGDVWGEIDNLISLRGRAQQRVDELERKGRSTSPIEKENLGRLKNINKLFDDFITGLGSLSNSNAVNPLYAIARAARIEEIIKQNTEASDSSSGAITSRFIFLSIPHAGGSDRTTRNLFTGSRVRYSGGVLVEYMLFSSEGYIEYSDVIDSHSGFTRFESEDASDR